MYMKIPQEMAEQNLKQIHVNNQMHTYLKTSKPPMR